MSQIDDPFHSDPDQIINPCKSLVVLNTHIFWQELEASVAHRLARQIRTRKRVKIVDLFGQNLTTALESYLTGLATLPGLMSRVGMYGLHELQAGDLYDRWIKHDL